MAARRPRRHVKVESADGFWRGHFYAMASPCEILCETGGEDEARQLTEAAARETWRIEDKFSRYRTGNIVDRINKAAGGPIDVDEETAQLIDFSVTLYELSDGRFDITSGALRRVWRFDGSSNIPSQDAIDEVLQNVGWHRVSWESPRLQMPAGMQIDFGGIGKEYAADRVASRLREMTPASSLVNLGGDLVAVRRPRQRRAWKVGIESVNATSAGADTLLSLEIGALATSGDARRYLLANNKRYSHILDPKTGWPVTDAPSSITVAADTCTQAGMLSTLAMLEGTAAEAFLDAQQVRYWCKRDTAAVTGNRAILSQ
jgi:thiamine biosynthesis lipoprotein